MDVAAPHDPALPRLIDVVVIEAVHDAVRAGCCRADRAEQVNRPFAAMVVATRQPDVTGTVDVPDVYDLIPDVRLIGKESFDRRPPFKILPLRIVVIVDREVPANRGPAVPLEHRRILPARSLPSQAARCTRDALSWLPFVSRGCC